MPQNTRKPPPETQRVQPCPSCGRQWELPRDAMAGHSFCPGCRFPLMLLAGKYRLTQSLGSGTFGDVYLAQHVALEQTPDRVVKVLKPEMFAKPEARLRFQREIQLTCVLSLQNEHIVRIFDDFGEIPGLGWFYVMEYLQGMPLGGLLKDPDEAPSVGLICDIMCQLCDGMAAAHRQQIVHRDLKPDNIFLIERHETPYFVKILDFGIAKPLNAIADGSLTGQYRMLGTPLYMSPEQCLNSPLDHRSDIYAMGVILYELLTGRTPFFHRAKGGLTALIQAHVNEVPTPPQTLRPHHQIPDALQRIALRAIEKDPEQRFSSVQEMKEALLTATPHTSGVQTLSWEEPEASETPPPFTPQSLDALLPTPDIHEIQAVEVAYLVGADEPSLPDASLLDADAPPTQPERPAFDGGMVAYDAPRRRKGHWLLLLLGLLVGGAAISLWQGVWPTPWQRVATTHEDPPHLGTWPQDKQRVLPKQPRQRWGIGTPLQRSQHSPRNPATTSHRAVRLTPPSSGSDRALPRQADARKLARRRQEPRQTMAINQHHIPRRRRPGRTSQSRLTRRRPRANTRPRRRALARARPAARRHTSPKGCPTRAGIQWIRIDTRPKSIVSQLDIGDGIPSRLIHRGRSWFCLGFAGQGRRQVSLKAPGFRLCRLTLRPKPPLISVKLDEIDNDALEQGSLDYCKQP